MKTNLTTLKTRLLIVGVFVTFLFLPFFYLILPAQAGGVFTVTRFDDPAPGNCDPNDCSLREAIKAANLALGGTIELPSGTYTLTIAGTNEDGNATGDLDINSSLTIHGDPNGVAIIRGGPAWADRIFHVFAGLTVHMNHVAIEYGNSDFWGGGIYNYGGLLTLSNCAVMDNLAVAGGGIMNDNGGTLTITNCAINFNEASNNGGGIYVGNNTIATINNSQFYNNTNSGIVNWGEVIVVNTEFNNNAGGWGAGVSNSGTATINNCEFISNDATIVGGALSNNGADLVLNIQSSSFISNTAVSGGGALMNMGTIMLSDSTISGNSSPGTGGGIHNDGSMTVEQTIIDNNQAAGIYAIGGGIHNSGAITLTNSDLTNNTALAGWGGGLVNTDVAWASLTSSDITGNQAQKGGGIYNFGAMIIDQSAIIQNTSLNATDSGGGIFNAHQLTIAHTSVLTNSANGQGGGIFNGGTSFYTTTGTLTMTQSTIAWNTAVNSHGGGLAVLTGTVSLENSTLSGNSTTRHGGGIYNSTGAVGLNNVTVAENTADSNQLSLGDGGGFYTQGGSFALSNSLIAANVDGSSESPDCWGVPTSQEYNLVQNIQGCGFVAASGDIIGQNAQLGPLADNGGFTFTHALMGGSPAIDTANPVAPGSSNACSVIDQRGETRPADGNDDGEARCDMGAYETGPITLYLYLPVIIR